MTLYEMALKQIQATKKLENDPRADKEIMQQIRYTLENLLEQWRIANGWQRLPSMRKEVNE